MNSGDYKKASMCYLLGNIFNKGIAFLTVPIFTRILCAIEMAQNEQPDYSKVSNTVAQNCTPNQINKNNLRLNQLNRTKEAY